MKHQNFKLVITTLLLICTVFSVHARAQIEEAQVKFCYEVERLRHSPVGNAAEVVQSNSACNQAGHIPKLVITSLIRLISSQMSSEPSPDFVRLYADAYSSSLTLWNFLNAKEMGGAIM